MSSARMPLTKQRPLVGRTPRKPPRRNAGKEPSDNVEVYCRIRPMENSAEATCIKRLNETTAVLATPDIPRNGPAYKETHYSFQRVYDEETSQKTLFEHIGLPLVADVLNGKNGLLFAYGVTSSGKTFTMNGSEQDPGIIPRCLDCIFRSIGELLATKYVFKPDKMNGFDVQSEADALLERQLRDVNPKLLGNERPPSREKAEKVAAPVQSDEFCIECLEQDNNYAVFVSYVEIYNNYVYDLLEDLPFGPIAGVKPPASKLIREDGEHNMYVSGVVEMEVMNSEEAIDVILKGQKRRKVACTSLNAESSRSHSVFSIRIVQSPLDPNGEHVILDKKRICISQLSLVDLAGSERCLRTGTAGDRLKEASSINQTLMVLRSCIEALRDNQNSGSSKVISYRESRLTMLFKTYFDGTGKVRMVVCVNPRASDYDETVNVMKFAELTQEVQVARAQQVHFDVGLTPGRRALNLQYRDNLLTPKQNSESSSIFQRAVYDLGPSFPSLELFTARDEVHLPLLANFLKERSVIRSNLLEEMGDRENSFRANLLKMQTDQRDLLRTNNQLETEVQELRRRVDTLEKNNSLLEQKNSKLEHERLELEREIGDKSWKVLHEKLEKERLKKNFNDKILLTEQRHSHDMEQAERRMKENEAKMVSKVQKLCALRTIINEDSDSGSSVSDTPRALPASAYNSKSRTVPAQSILNVARIGLTPTSNFKVPRQVPGAVQAYTTRFGFRRGLRTKSPPPVLPKPMAGKLKRRSRSSDCLWLDQSPDSGNDVEVNPRATKPISKFLRRDLEDKNMDINATSTKIHTESAPTTSMVSDDDSTKKKLSRKRHSSCDSEASKELVDAEISLTDGSGGLAKRPKVSAV